MLFRRKSGEGLPGRLQGGVTFSIGGFNNRLCKYQSGIVCLSDPSSQHRDGLHRLLRFLVTLFHLWCYMAVPPRVISPIAPAFPLSVQCWHISSSHHTITRYGMCSRKWKGWCLQGSRDVAWDYTTHISHLLLMEISKRMGGWLVQKCKNLGQSLRIALRWIVLKICK